MRRETSHRPEGTPSIPQEGDLDPTDADQRQALSQVLILNAALAAVLMVGGLMADSSALLANALDNSSDAMAYGVSYAAVSRSRRWKSLAAAITGIMLLVLAAGVTYDALRRFSEGSQPLGGIMVGMSIVAVAINAWCVRIFLRFRGSDVNLRAAWTMSLNDFASNIGIVVAGVLVAYLGSNWPDLILALLIAVIAGYGGAKTLLDVHQQRSDRPTP